MSFARLANYRQSPRKVRLVADVVRGMSVNEATAVLTHLDKRAASIVGKVISSAASNATHNHDLNRDDLYVSDIRVDEGVTLKRFRPRARGRAFPIRKRTSHIVVRLSTKGGDIVAEEKSASNKVEKKTTVKKATKSAENKTEKAKPTAKKTKTEKKPAAKKETSKPASKAKK